MQGEGEEEQVCPPLFGFASLSTAGMLDSITTEVLGPHQKQRNSRCAGVAVHHALELPEDMQAPCNMKRLFGL